MADNNSQRDVFISYSRKNKADVMLIKDEIERVLGIKCWMDLEGIESGSREFTQDIIEAIDASMVFLFFLSTSSQESEWALKEIDYAKSENKHVVLVRFNADPMAKKFRFEFGRTDIIDWRDSLQKTKLLRDIISWTSDGQRSTDSLSASMPSLYKAVPSSQPLYSAGECKTFMLPGGAKLEMIYCPPGEFIMGSSQAEEWRGGDEMQHRVRLTKGFWIGKYPVTQLQWKSVMVSNPSHFKGDRLPVEQVSWDDCQKYIRMVNLQRGSSMRLPTEAEWEYACRAGTTTAFFWGNKLNGDKANCYGSMCPYGTTVKGPNLERTTPVGWYEANPWGVYDMHGNVFEWCNDWYGDYPLGFAIDPIGSASGVTRVMRGGSWKCLASCCRSAYRSRCVPDPDPDSAYGFRLCCYAIIT